MNIRVFLKEKESLHFLSHIPLANVFGQFARSYRDVIIVDCLGREIGRTTVDDRNKGPNGEEYDNPDDWY